MGKLEGGHVDKAAVPGGEAVAFCWNGSQRRSLGWGTGGMRCQAAESGPGQHIVISRDSHDCSGASKQGLEAGGVEEPPSWSPKVLASLVVLLEDELLPRVLRPPSHWALGSVPALAGDS